MCPRLSDCVAKCVGSAERKPTRKKVLETIRSQGRINDSRYHLAYSLLTDNCLSRTQPSPKPITRLTVLHYANKDSSQSRLGSEIANFHPYRFAPTTGSLKPSKKKHNSVTVVCFCLEIGFIITRQCEKVNRKKYNLYRKNKKSYNKSVVFPK